MTRTLYDGAPSHIPTSAKFVVVGSPEEAARHPGAQVLLLDHDGTHPEYDILDYESIYYHNPQGVRQWAQDHWRLKGTPPTFYANPHNYQIIAPYLAGVRWDWWTREITGRPHAYQPRPGEKIPVATQWWGSGLPGWNHFDISLVTDDGWHSGTAGGSRGWGNANGNVPPVPQGGQGGPGWSGNPAGANIPQSSGQSTASPPKGGSPNFACLPVLILIAGAFSGLITVLTQVRW